MKNFDKFDMKTKKEQLIEMLESHFHIDCAVCSDKFPECEVGAMPPF